jgi:ABC-type dipeptide/oligopeptide/nickel transport system permease component
LLTYFGRRLLAAIPTLWEVPTAVFVIAHLLSCDPARVIAGVLAPPRADRAAALPARLDQPLLVQ